MIIVNKINPSCSTELVTPTGKFTFHDEEVSICEAKKICAKNGEILAPITNRQDYNAIIKVTKMGNHPSCPFHHGDQMYFIGLDITPCGKGKQDKVFSNGVVWNEKIHGKLYVDQWESDTSPCAYAEFGSWGSNPWLSTWGDLCYEKTSRFLCLKPSNPVKVQSNSCGLPEAIKSSDEQNFTSVAIIAFCGIACVFFAFIAVKYYKKYRSIEKKHKQVKADLKFLKK